MARRYEVADLVGISEPLRTVVANIFGSTYGTPSNTREPHNPIFQQMLIRSCEANSSSVGRKLELDTTNNGVIGRTMSVEVQGQVIGEGIIGRL